MNHLKKYAIVFASCLCLTTSAPMVLGANVITAEAHSGRTDSHGGHKDNKNKSGLGSYHYHCGGHPAHLHTNGICPYASSSSGSGSQASSASGSASASGSTSASAPGSAAAGSASSGSVTTDSLSDYQAVFDASYYYHAYPDLQSAIGSDSIQLLCHFLDSGMAEGRKGCEDFDVQVYRENNPDLDDAFGDDLKQYYLHYINSGCHEGRTCK